MYLNLLYQCNAGINVETCSGDLTNRKLFYIHELLCHFFKQVVWREKNNAQGKNSQPEPELKLIK